MLLPLSSSHHLIIPNRQQRPKRNRTKHFYSILFTLKNIFYVAAMNVPTLTLDSRNIAYHGGKLLEKISPADSRKNDGVFRISFYRHATQTIASQNGFIWAAAEAFDRQSGVIIRVDDIWLAVLAQLKPFIYQAVWPLILQYIPNFTRAELNDTQVVAERLCNVVNAMFGPKIANILIRHFSTTTATDSGAAALIMLGRDCQVQHHRRFDKPLEPDNRAPIIVVGDTKDWNTLRETFAILRTWSPELEKLISHHSKFLDEMLQREFWDRMLKVEDNGQQTVGWLLNFFDPKKLAQTGPFRFNIEMPSAVTTIPIKADHGQGPRNCTMVGGLLGHSRDSSGVVDPDTRRGFHIVQPMSGWLVYYDKSPETVKTEEVIVIED
ncbi:hypothetical protein FGADI_1617 [Fusarium gaditjirri]|uniref:Uncharacterized protein n=1 Tax=Fusarium gaditjirri TaxID=282569 RepID=A0A8H4TKE4_9HYPO|nr:hypothetical protein FGADI_1617 [Fusarium gaditjirri]